MVFENQINCQEKIEQTENEQDEVEIAFDELEDSNGIALNLDSSGQYQLQGESVTYRLVQLTSPHEVQHILSSLSSNQSPLQNNKQSALMQSDQKPSYVQTTSPPETPHSNHSKKRQVIVLATQQQQQQAYNPPNNSNNVPKSIVPKKMVIKSEPITKSMKDDRRRFTHKEVERRRRDKINMWIVQLGNLIPECSQQVRQTDSKGGILSKACEYITQLQGDNQEMEESLKAFDEVKNHLQLLNQQFQQLKQENHLLRSHLQQQQQPFADHNTLISHGGVVLLDETVNNNNFNFLNNNTDDEALYVDNTCLVTEANNDNIDNINHNTKPPSITIVDNDSYHAESEVVLLCSNNNNTPESTTAPSHSNNNDDDNTNNVNNNNNKVGNFKTIILKNVSSNKRRVKPLVSQLKKVHKM